MAKTIAVIPAFNEARHVQEVIHGVYPFVDEVIVADDGSNDATAEQARATGKALVVRHRMNLGKGAALKTGCDYAIQRGAESIVCLDADGQHLPEEVPLLLKELHGGTNDVVFGVRTSSETTMPLVARFGNWFLTTATTVLFGVRITDTQCGYRGFTNAAYKKIRWESTNYAVETEMIVRAGKARLRVREVPITTVYLDRYKGTTIFDGVRIFCNMLLWRIR